MRRRSIHTRPRGFTLTELLVSVAVFSVLASSIFVLWQAAHEANQTAQVQTKVYNQARAALGLIERDLQAAFNAREYGDYFQFYGTPIGFMFVGVVPDPAEDTYNLARITYAIQLQTERGGFLTDADGDGERDEPVLTFSLIRYVEPGVSNLDSFQFGEATWNRINYAVGQPPENPTAEALWRELRSAYLEATFGRNVDGDGQLERIGLTGRTLEDYMTAKKRELWIRYIAGDPSIVRNLPTVAASRDDRQRPPGAVFEPGDPFNREYVILTDIASDELQRIVQNWNARPQLLPFDADGDGNDRVVLEQGLPSQTDPDLVAAFFNYGYVPGTEGGLPIFTNYWLAGDPQSRDRLLAGNFTAPGSVSAGRLPELVRVRLPMAVESPYTGAPDYRQVFERVIDVPTGYARSARAGL